MSGVRIRRTFYGQRISQRQIVQARFGFAGVTILPDHREEWTINLRDRDDARAYEVALSRKDAERVVKEWTKLLKSTEKSK